ncbi:YbaB/EbfC family nucleoid-associated protein [Nocardia sp. NPDC127579]|uniref:YbaB/EbfC family nucleoid-associated protein n=1 Tax=Nocardia sp. NPDC127579 TaxID=3345402 RepID=UPI00363F3F61
MRDRARELIKEQMLAGLSEQIQALNQAQRQRAELIVNGTAADGLVTVTVNADGGVLDIQFAPGAIDLGRQKLARATTEAVQNAQRQAAQRNTEIFQPVLGAAAGRDLADVMTDFDEIAAMIPGPQAVTTELPTIDESPRPDYADTVSPAESRASVLQTTSADDLPLPEPEDTGDQYEEIRPGGFGRATDVSW